MFPSQLGTMEFQEDTIYGRLQFHLLYLINIHLGFISNYILKYHFFIHLFDGNLEI